MNTRTWIVVGLLLVAGRHAAAQTRPDLAGRWVRDGQAEPGLEDVLPAWEQITIDNAVVDIVRSSHADRTERYQTDGAERTTTRVRVGRACRAAWTADQLVLTCRESADGPGGGAAPILTRETRSLTPDGHLQLELVWRSGDQTVTRVVTFHRAESQSPTAPVSEERVR